MKEALQPDNKSPNRSLKQSSRPDMAPQLQQSLVVTSDDKTMASKPSLTSEKQERCTVTSDCKTMTSTPSLTSETEEQSIQMTSKGQNNTAAGSTLSLRRETDTAIVRSRCPNSYASREDQGSVDDCACGESEPFFCSCARITTIIHNPGTAGSKLKNAGIQTNGQAMAAGPRITPGQDAPREAPEKKDVEEEEKERGKKEKEEERDKEKEEEKDIGQKEEKKEVRDKEEESGKEEEEERGKEEKGENWFPPTVLDTPIGALRKSKRRLCLMLNIEMMYRDDTGLCADFRGLAELVGFEALEIDNFWERNPSDTLFLEWARCRDSRLQPAVLSSLVSCLLLLDRKDVLEDCQGLILEDVSDYRAEENLKIRYSVGRQEQYHCYVNIADADLLTVGREIVESLEGVYGLRLCLTLRDVHLTDCLYDNMAHTLETRCNGKVLLVLTKNYEDSEACQFLMRFAVSLDPGARNKKLIPLLVDEDAFIPRILRGFSRLNFKRDKELGYLWPRLNHAITR
ncbi:hypothetical protein ACOMHN_059987 [Nucella lapillus]